MYLAADTVLRLQTQLTQLKAQIKLANTALDGIAAKEIESFSLDTNEGKQSAKRWDAAKLDTLIATLERRAEHIRQRLAGMGVMNLNARRTEDM